MENRLSAVDVTVPGGRYIIASDKDGSMSPAANPLAPAASDSLRHERRSGTGSKSAPAQLSPVCAAVRSGLDNPGQHRNGDSGGIRSFPESVGIQRSTGVCAQPALLSHEEHQHSCRRSDPDIEDAQHPDLEYGGKPGRQYDGLRLPDRVHGHMDVQYSAAIVFEHDG